MGLFDFLKRGKASAGHDLAELARRLGVDVDSLRATLPNYNVYHIAKRSGRGKRTIQAPDAQLKQMQRRIHRRLLALLVVHPCCIGFERGKSIVDHASLHAGKAVVLRMDIRDFFPSTSARRVEQFFLAIGWNKESTKVLARLCTLDGGLPQGAPTSPRLANLVNFKLDMRLAGLAQLHGAVYSRYADDLTFSWPGENADVNTVKHAVRGAVEDFGYRINSRKSCVRRRHQQQRVTGLVVNERPRLPRDVRKRLRAIEHQLQTRGTATMTRDQLAGWHAFSHMVDSPKSR